jgi:tyrosyl-tRNA synthetase
MLKLRQFQRFGHEVTFLMGTMTATVGDPSDKSAARQMLTPEEVEANTGTWLEQAFKVLDPERTRIARNGDWLSSLTLAQLVDLASHFTVAQFLDHETFRRRMDEGKPLYLHEFVYALMQAYDAHTLQTEVQVGGTDQLFNIMAGRQLQRGLGERPLVAVCVPLLIGTDGKEKMGKSLGNYIAINEPPAEMYGKVMSIPDSLLLNYYTHLTDATTQELEELARGLEEQTANAMQAKKALAHHVVKLLHGPENAETAQLEFERVFQQREQPEDAQELPVELDAAGSATVDVSQLLSQSGVVSSRSEARRLLAQGALALDGKRLLSPKVTVSAGQTLRIGPHRFFRITGRAG